MQITNYFYTQSTATVAEESPSCMTRINKHLNTQVAALKAHPLVKKWHDTPIPTWKKMGVAGLILTAIVAPPVGLLASMLKGTQRIPVTTVTNNSTSHTLPTQPIAPLSLPTVKPPALKVHALTSYQRLVVNLTDAFPTCPIASAPKKISPVELPSPAPIALLAPPMRSVAEKIDNHQPANILAMAPSSNATLRADIAAYPLCTLEDAPRIQYNLPSIPQPLRYEEFLKSLPSNHHNTTTPNTAIPSFAELKAVYDKTQQVFGSAIHNLGRALEISKPVATAIANGGITTIKATAKGTWTVVRFVGSPIIDSAKWILFPGADAGFLHKKISKAAKLGIGYGLWRYAKAHPDSVLNRDAFSEVQNLNGRFQIFILRTVATVASNNQLIAQNPNPVGHAFNPTTAQSLYDTLRFHYIPRMLGPGGDSDILFANIRGETFLTRTLNRVFHQFPDFFTALFRGH